MNKQMSLDLFREALDAAQEQLEDEMTAGTGEVVVTREEHEKGVARIMATFRRYKATRLKRRILISILAAALVILTSCTIYANREKIAAFVEKFYHTYIDVSYTDIDENAPQEIQQVYLPSYIPEGYELTDSHSNTTRVRMKWVNQNGEKIIYVQTLLTGDLLSLDSEMGEPKILTVGGISVYYAEYSNTQYSNENIYVWNDGDYSYKLTVTADFPIEEIEKLITLAATESE